MPVKVKEQKQNTRNSLYSFHHSDLALRNQINSKSSILIKNKIFAVNTIHMNIFASLSQGLGVSSLNKLQKPRQKHRSAGLGCWICWLGLGGWKCAMFVFKEIQWQFTSSTTINRTNKKTFLKKQ